jgi:hypothetical protein
VGELEATEASQRKQIEDLEAKVRLKVYMWHQLILVVCGRVDLAAGPGCATRLVSSTFWKSRCLPYCSSTDGQERTSA